MKTTLIATALILRMVSVTEAHKGTVVHTVPEIQIRAEVSAPAQSQHRDMQAATDSAFTAIMLQLNESIVKRSTAAREKPKPQLNGAYAADVRIIGLMQ